MKHLFLIFFGVIFLSSCIGTDLVEEVEVPNQVLISTPNTSIKVGDEVQFMAIFTNNYGVTESKTIFWSTSTPDLISVSTSGLVKATKLGEAILIATVENTTTTRRINITMDNIPDVNSSTRSGQFRSAGSGSYTVSGDVSITTTAGKSVITVKDNFKASVGPSLFLMLTNHTNGSYMVVNNNPAINGTSAQISLTRLTKFQGMMSWEVPAGVDVNNYKFALLYCTLGPVFGYAELK